MLDLIYGNVDQPRSAVNVLILVLKFVLNVICSFGDIAIVIYQFGFLTFRIESDPSPNFTVTSIEGRPQPVGCYPPTPSPGKSNTGL